MNGLSALQAEVFMEALGVFSSCIRVLPLHMP
jgi:hypothetical protein